MKLVISILAVMHLFSCVAFAGEYTDPTELAPGSRIRLSTELTFDALKGWRSAYFVNGEQVNSSQIDKFGDRYCSLSIYARERNPKIQGRLFVASPYISPALRGAHQGLILEGTATSGKPVSMFITCMDPFSWANTEGPAARYISGDRNTELGQIQNHIGSVLTLEKTLVGNPVRDGEGVYTEIE